MKCICLRGEIHLLACLFALFQLRNFLHEFTEKTFAVFDQSSHAIYLTWYWLLLFFQEFSSVTHFMVWLFFNWKLNILSFIFFIWTEQFFIWSSRKLTKRRNFHCFKKLSLFYPLYDFKILVQIYQSII